MLHQALSSDNGTPGLSALEQESMMKFFIGPDGNEIYQGDTVGGVPAFTYESIMSRINTQRGRQPWRPDYGADFPSCVRRADPLRAVTDEVAAVLGGELLLDRSVETTQNDATGMIDVKIEEFAESGNWALTFSIDLTDGAVVDFPQCVVDGKR